MGVDRGSCGMTALSCPGHLQVYVLQENAMNQETLLYFEMLLIHFLE